MRRARHLGLAALAVLLPMLAARAQVPQAPSLGSYMLSPSGQVNAGFAVYQEHCAGCHENAGHSTVNGPSLRGVFNNSVAQDKKWGFTTALRYSGHIWNTAQLDAFLADPARFIPGTNMYANTALPDAEDRRNVIAYLMTLQ